MSSPGQTRANPPAARPSSSSSVNRSSSLGQLPPAGPPGTYTPGSVLSVNTTKVVVERFLAEGGFAHVYVVLVGSEQAPAVLKRVACPDEEGVENLKREILFLKQLSGHKNIVRYMDSSVQTLRGGGFEVFILMEYCAGGHLVDFLNTRLTTRLSEAEVLNIFSDVCEAVAHMHYQNPPVIHRDIKVENVLLASPGLYKLCDFGSATTKFVPAGVPMSAYEIRALEEEVGKFTTSQYRAPELCDLYQKKGMSYKVDMWALGVLLYKLCFFTTPFEDSGTLAVLNVRYTMPTYPSYSRELLSIIGEQIFTRLFWQYAGCVG
ncbi:hypothetical protein HK104_006425 [Borealophlyctis nickersoniae]|nr:hypothetical protein HK104_006425 [Borealophlyctis nickersoniae]